MLSIITCSVSKSFLSKFIISIEKTIDIAYEIIVIDNSIEKLYLAEAYNRGAAKAKYPFLVFVHEDVEFLNLNWASNLVEILDNPKVGIVGIAGSTYLPSSPSSWYMPDDGLNKVFIHQGFKYSGFPERFDNRGEDLTPVYLLDGVLLAMRREVFNEFPFNEKLKGFHAYDADICHRVVKKYKNLFTNQIELIHHSEGKPDKLFFDMIVEYKKSYLDYPFTKRNFYVEFEIIKQLFIHLRVYYSRNEVVKVLHPYVKIKNLGLFNFFKIKKIFNS